MGLATTAQRPTSAEGSETQKPAPANRSTHGFVVKTQSGIAIEPLVLPAPSVRDAMNYVILLGAFSVAVIAILSFLGFA